MNIDQLLIDIIRDKTKGKFTNNVLEVMKEQNVTKEEVLKSSIQLWFNIKPSSRLKTPSNKTKHASGITKTIREICPYHTQVRAKLYFYFLKKNDRDAILSNSDD